MKQLLILIAVAFLMALPAQVAQAQQGTWTEQPGRLSEWYIAYAGPGEYYTTDIPLRPGQQQLRFTTARNALGACFMNMRVRVTSPYSGSWQTLYNDPDHCITGHVGWPGVPTSDGAYRIELEWTGIGGLHTLTYDLFTAPNANRAFRDTAGNEMLLWSGGTDTALDQPFLLLEGLDADNVVLPPLYYVLSGGFFDRGRRRGMDILVMNFASGGASIETNAGVAERAVQYINSIKTGSRKLDLAGHSMGGIIARYTLASMEERSIAHNVGRYVSLDAPHQGAVLDLELQHWLKQQLVLENIDENDVPANLQSDAGKQLLTYNAFDMAVPSMRHQFAQLLATTNGNGYPHQTTENIGVSFGAATIRNPNEGEVWLEVLLPVLSNPRFEIQNYTPEALPGSFLPKGSTRAIASL